MRAYPYFCNIPSERKVALELQVFLKLEFFFKSVISSQLVSSSFVSAGGATDFVSPLKSYVFSMLFTVVAILYFGLFLHP